MSPLHYLAARCYDSLVMSMTHCTIAYLESLFMRQVLFLSPQITLSFILTVSAVLKVCVRTRTIPHSIQYTV